MINISIGEATNKIWVVRMSDHTMKNDAQEFVTTNMVACDGGDGEMGHPKVYLEIKASVGEVRCPYCQKLFIYKSA